MAGSGFSSNWSRLPWRFIAAQEPEGTITGRSPAKTSAAVFCDLARGAPIAGVEGGLAATGLVFRKLDGQAEVFEHFDGGAGDVVVKGITEAGAHEEHAFAERAGGGIGHGEIAFPQARDYGHHRNPENTCWSDFSRGTMAVARGPWSRRGWVP